MRFVRQRRQSDRDSDIQTNPILRRPINHNDYFTLSSRNSLNDDQEPLIIQPNAPQSQSHVTVEIQHTQRSGISNQGRDSISEASAISARSTTGKTLCFFKF